MNLISCSLQTYEEFGCFVTKKINLVGLYFNLRKIHAIKQIFSQFTLAKPKQQG